MCWTRKSHLQQQKALIKVLLLVLLSVDLLGDGSTFNIPLNFVMIRKMHYSHYRACHKWTMLIPSFHPFKPVRFQQVFPQQDVVHPQPGSNLQERLWHNKDGQLLVNCLNVAIYDQRWSKPCFSIAFLWCQRYVWLHYQRSTIACLHRLGAWISICKRM